jgi:hypothetical protein
VSGEYVSLKQLAAELGMDRSHARRYVLNLGVTPTKRRTPESGGQLTLTVSAQEAEFLRRTREEQGFLKSERAVTSEKGYFYIIQLVPDLDPTRLKLGFADTVEARLAQHRTSAPTARLLKSWPCKRIWERTAIDALAAVGGRLILNEVFEFSDVDAVLKRGDEFFALLPDPARDIPLADKSPHNEG